jgi:hypothetical protein
MQTDLLPNSWGIIYKNYGFVEHLLYRKGCLNHFSLVINNREL